MDKIKTIGVVGAGTMGAGIAQLIVQHGFTAFIFDVDEKKVTKAKASIEARLARLAEKKKLSFEEVYEAKKRLHPSYHIENFQNCEIIIEAVPEKVEIKRAIFQQLEKVCRKETILATNTSSISITQISGMIEHPERVAGLHFFNPATIMPLVEVIQGLNTAAETVETLVAFAKKLNKNPVVCKDTPGFIVNRVARPFYNEALRIMNDQVATVEQIDRIMKQAGNFKMGPFELQDLIGIDVNFATTKSVHASFYGESRFRPHYYQERMVDSGRLGKKTRGGFFHYE
ncbi:3-hydroxybutyryl-CoA dehydrogenase [Bacillus aquiflavi]|uniref:3-hydroxyacyl-CoA dehydrogenase NAD-binding domain-containing protein n=1 Tax=Bacillus aquiflavi TaxID=2672567 RepID=UPI001CA85C07|nr:3-hydroxyacyl-CoA dehydrogenase NAD-binding domain-containing protein [Bacillus aquiflavi]UAC49838.1 3-hydroxybutyryl-CoA dehydrogenase [Bacillus aquiflavi]